MTTRTAIGLLAALRALAAGVFLLGAVLLGPPGGVSGAAPAIAPPAPPPVSAEAVYVVDIDAGAELYARNPDERLPAGSTLKMATALVVRRHADLDDLVVVDASDEVDAEVYSHLGIVAGDEVTVEDLLWGMLLPSGSDAAKALARHVGATLPGGDADDPAASRAAFVAAMNDLATELGLANTRFANPTGDDDPEQYASARDLALLATEVLNDETLARIVRTPAWEGVTAGPEPRPLAVKNVNQLLLEDEAVLGVKTGATPDAGACLVAARRYADGNRVVSVVLGSTGRFGPEGTLVEDGRWDDTRALFAGLAADYRWLSPTDPELLPGLAEELAVWGVELGPGPALPVPAEGGPELRHRLVLGPEGPPGSEVGRVRFYVGDAPVGERPVVQTAG